MVLKINKRSYPIHNPQEVAFFESAGNKLRIAYRSGRTDVIDCETPEALINALIELEKLYNARDKN